MSYVFLDEYFFITGNYFQSSSVTHSCDITKSECGEYDKLKEKYISSDNDKVHSNDESSLMGKPFAIDHRR